MHRPVPRRHFLANTCFSTRQNTFGVALQLRRPPAKQQFPGSQRQPKRSLAYGVQRARGEKGHCCFAEQRCICAAVCSRRRIDLSGVQLSEPRFELSVRWRLGDELPSWLWGDCRGLHPEGIFLPTPASPRRRTGLEWIPSSGYYHQSSRGQGARGSPDPLWPMLTRGLGEKKASIALLSKLHWGCGLFPEDSLPFQNAVLRTSFRSVSDMSPQG